MKEIFDFLMDEYLLDKSLNIDSDKDYYKKFVRELPDSIYRYFDFNKYLVKSSIGVGQRSEIPWVCIFDRSVTTSATKGIYICVLFRKDMSGFYLELGQGITTFDQLFGKDKYSNIERVAKYFRNLIDSSKFSSGSIDLKGTKPLSKGYESGTIISKFYEKNNYNESELIRDLLDLKSIYEDICSSMRDDSYMNVVYNVIQNMDPSFIIATDANKIIENAILDEAGLDQAEFVCLDEVDIPVPKAKNKYSVIRKESVKKIDQLKKAKTNAKNGLLGEELVLTYEQERLRKIGREDLISQIRWVSKEDDTTGYDIISFDVDFNGDISEKYIEVKTTEGSCDSVFYISANEVDTMEKIKNNYYIYRVFNLKSKHPQLYILDYNDFKNRINLSVDNYVASLNEVK